MSPVRLLLAISVAACGTGRVPTPSGVPDDARSVVVHGPDTPRAAPAVRFIQGMIPHHAQALAMTTLVPARSQRDDIRLIAQRIERSQKDEIAAMERWLRRRGEAVPKADPHHTHHGAAGSQPLMPGMLTHEELMQLEKSTGSEFDRLFLEKMIRHHEGALTMVHELFGAPGSATQDPELYQLASDVDADQRAEINRMQTLLRALP